MKTSLGFIAGTWLLVAGPVALGTTTVTLTDTDGDGNPSGVSVAPGSSIVVNISASAAEMINSFQCNLTAGTSNILDVTALTYETGWDQPGSDIGLPFTYEPPYALNPSLTIGSARSALDSVTGSILLGIVTIQVHAAAAPGLYTLNLTVLEMGDENFDVVDVSVGPDYQITVTSTAPPGGSGGGGGVTPPPDTPPPPPPDGGGTEPPPDGTPTDNGGSTTTGGTSSGGGTTDPTGGTTDTGGTQDGSGSTVTPPPKAPQPVCGSGAPQAMMFCLTGLFWLHGRSRRKR